MSTLSLPLGLGLTAGALAYRERRTRLAAERLSAALLETLLNAIDATDRETGAHVRRVARYALILADAAGLNEHELRSVERIALFHDIGKIHEALFDIMHDPKKLTPDQRRAVATHPERGVNVLAPLAGFYPELCEGVLSHHERWDGSGYPRRLRRSRIPFTARIVSIADTFDAVRHHRRYRDGESSAQAVEAIGAGRGTQFDPSLVDLFLLPPVFHCIEDAVRQSYARTPKRADRRHGSADQAPDVTFRWRRRSSQGGPLAATR